jgi:hypothetical protein
MLAKTPKSLIHSEIKEQKSWRIYFHPFTTIEIEPFLGELLTATLSGAG